MIIIFTSSKCCNSSRMLTEIRSDNITKNDFINQTGINFLRFKGCLNSNGRKLSCTNAAEFSKERSNWSSLCCNNVDVLSTSEEALELILTQHFVYLLFLLLFVYLYLLKKFQIWHRFLSHFNIAKVTDSSMGNLVPSDAFGLLSDLTFPFR